MVAGVIVHAKAPIASCCRTAARTPNSPGASLSRLHESAAPCVVAGWAATFVPLVPRHIYDVTT